MEGAFLCDIILMNNSDYNAIFLILAVRFIVVSKYSQNCVLQVKRIPTLRM